MMLFSVVFFLLVAPLSGRLTQLPRIALTREMGHNTKLRRLLFDIDCVELPCTETVPSLPDLAALRHEIDKHDIILATSPNTARMLVEAWRRERCPAISVAAVGQGTARILRNYGIIPVFVSTIATGKHLAETLPHSSKSAAHSRAISVLYPTSALAPDTIPRTLRRRGFAVTRRNIYTTRPSVWPDVAHEIAIGCSAVALASPSAASIWHSRVGGSVPAIVIGPTTAEKCKDLGFGCVMESRDCNIEALANTIRQYVTTAHGETA